MVLSDPFMNEIDVIRSGQLPPFGEQFPTRLTRLAFHLLNVLKQFVLRHGAQPAEGIPAGVGPGGRRQTVNVKRRAIRIFESFRNFRGVGDDDVIMPGQGFRNPPPEFENTFIFPDVLSDVLVIIAQQHGLAVYFGDEGGILLRGDRLMGEAESHVITEFPVAWNDNESAVLGPEDRIRRNGTIRLGKHVFPLLAEDGEVTHIGHDVCDIIVIHEFGVPEGRRKDAEEFPDFVPVQRDLITEFLLLGIHEETGQRVVVGLIQIFHLMAFLTGI